MSQLNDFGYSYIKSVFKSKMDGESIVSICNEVNLELNQIQFIKEKLE